MPRPAPGPKSRQEACVTLLMAYDVATRGAVATPCGRRCGRLKGTGLGSESTGRGGLGTVQAVWRPRPP
jgi:hypothetical protein